MDSFEDEERGYGYVPIHNSSEKIMIQLSNPVIKDERFTKHAAYKITGEDSKGSFEIERRYKEFNMLQVLLHLQWPGCIIPQIPEKKAIVRV